MNKIGKHIEYFKDDPSGSDSQEAEKAEEGKPLLGTEKTTEKTEAEAVSR